MQKVIKWLLLGCILATLFLPLLQKRLHLIPGKSLYGDIRNTPNLRFTWQGWWDGSYQEQKANYLNDSMGFREYIVRINNQVDYSLFKKLHAHSVVMGKDHYLYEEGYLATRCGKDFLGRDVLLQKLKMLKMVQDTLDHMGKTMIFVFAPSKARFYPEYIPDDYRCAADSNTNYAVMSAAIGKMGIHYIDFNAWFLQHRTDRDSLLMSKQGIHWTKYGALLAADSISHYIEQQRQIQMKRVSITKMNFTRHPWEPQERDLALGLNLIAPITREQYNDPEYTFAGDSTKAMPRAIFIGDSFLWTFVYDNYFRDVYKHWEMWYYFSDAWSNDFESKGMSTYDWGGAFAQNDVTVFVFTEINLLSFSTYIDKIYGHFYSMPVK